MSAPLTPADCDLQDFPFMPLHVARLRDSDLAAEASPEACWYAVLLWAASWHQLPAGSLPDNDAVLTKLIGLGRDVRTFRKHKAAAMRGFMLCSDGRLYHPVVAEQVVAAWDSKLQQRWRTECARIKKQNQRTGADQSTPSFDDFIAGRSPVRVNPGPQNVPEDTPPSPSGQAVQETGTGTETIREEPPKPPTGGGTTSDDVLQAFDQWNATAQRFALPVARDLTASRRRAIRRRLDEHGLDGWAGALAAVEASPLCRGENDRQWRADLDFVCQAKSFTRLREGSYGPKGSGTGTAEVPPRPTFPGPQALRAWVVNHTSEDFAAAYLDTATWDQERRAIGARNKVCAAKLRDECGPVLERAKAEVAVVAAIQAAADQTQPAGAVA